MFTINGDGNCLFRALAHIVYGTQCCHLQMRKLLVEFVISNRQMFEPLIIAETFDQHIDRKACARVWGSHIELQAAASLFEMPVFLCTTSQSEDKHYKWMCYKPFTPEQLIYPPPQERPKTHDLLNHNLLNFATLVAVISIVCSPKTCNFHWFHPNYISNIHITTLLYVNWLFIYTCIYTAVTAHP